MCPHTYSLNPTMNLSVEAKRVLKMHRRLSSPKNYKTWMRIVIPHIGDFMSSKGWNIVIYNAEGRRIVATTTRLTVSDIVLRHDKDYQFDYLERTDMWTAQENLVPNDGGIKAVKNLEPHSGFFRQLSQHIDWQTDVIFEHIDRWLRTERTDIERDIENHMEDSPTYPIELGEDSLALICDGYGRRDFLNHQNNESPMTPRVLSSPFDANTEMTHSSYAPSEATFYSTSGIDQACFSHLDSDFVLLKIRNVKDIQNEPSGLWGEIFHNHRIAFKPSVELVLSTTVRNRVAAPNTSPFTRINLKLMYGACFILLLFLLSMAAFGANRYGKGV
jgi:hypothetical protein